MSWHNLRNLTQGYEMFASFTSGMLIGLSLIVAIGAQNAFVLKQGLGQQHVLAICLCCALSDAVLIAAGVFGFAQLIVVHQDGLGLAKYAGALFLGVYGARHAYAAWRGGQRLVLDSQQAPSLKRTLLICLALTWLNPHVYLDTVLLLGAISSQYSGREQYFAAGAILASVLFFFALGYGARFLQPLFRQARAWQILDGIIALIMWSIAYSLLH